MMQASAVLIGAALLAGCAVDTSVPGAAASGDGCDAAKASLSIGRPITAKLAETARKASGARAVRTITPGAMVTMDYRPDRLNLSVDEKGMVSAVRCG